MTTTSAPGLTTRERISQVALRLFADQGYDATSMREIAAELGISKPALYYHFDSKEGIVRALLTDITVQVSELVEWASEQPRSDELRREVLRRWSDIMQAHGLAMFRFVVANRKVLHDARPDHDGMLDHINDLNRILAPKDATVEDQLRIRMALMSINLAGVAGVDIDADDEEILAAARQVSLDLLPRS